MIKMPFKSNVASFNTENQDHLYLAITFYLASNRAIFNQSLDFNYVESI